MVIFIIIEIKEKRGKHNEPGDPQMAESLMEGSTRAVCMLALANVSFFFYFFSCISCLKMIITLSIITMIIICVKKSLVRSIWEDCWLLLATFVSLTASAYMQ